MPAPADAAVKRGGLPASSSSSSTTTTTTTTTTITIAYLTFNFLSAVGIIFVNKFLFSSLSTPFNFPLALSIIHYAVTYSGLLLLRHGGVFKPRVGAGMTPRLWLLSVVVGIAPGLNNLSLQLNSVGFYTVVKLLVTPMIVVLEWALQGRTVSSLRGLALVTVALGVAISSVSDLTLQPAGLLTASLWLPVAAIYKVFWSRTQKEDGWETMPLMLQVLPWSALWMVLMVPFVDPPGLAAFPFDAFNVLLIAVSGVAAFCVNYSGFLVLGHCQPLTHVVLGQVKSASLILGGALFFGQRPSARALLGAFIAITGSGVYAGVK